MAAPAIRIGLAGWRNPPAAKGVRRVTQSHLAYYAEAFSCVEINSSFYRDHRPATYDAWRRATPRSFRFAVKMPRTITHDRGLRDTRRDVLRFFAGIESLRSKLGAILIQLPPGLAFDARVAARFFRSLPRLGPALLACEPRHGSWFTDAADALFTRAGIARVAADPPRVDGAGQPGGDRTHTYFRWHGAPRVYHSSYDRKRLAALAAQVRTVATRPVWCIFDNTAAHAAWDNALRLRDLLGA